LRKGLPGRLRSRLTGVKRGVASRRVIDAKERSMPGRLSTAQNRCRLRLPLPDGFVAEDDAADEEHLNHVS
jgi:hypothetical protein